jgi:site-specific DNA recombinase
VHKGHSYAGDHAPIVDEPLWNDVQQILCANRVGRETGANATEPSLLAGLVFDAAGERLTPTHAVKKGTRYRYYVSQTLITASAKNITKGQRIPAASLEALVKNRLRELLVDPAAMLAATQDLVRDAADQRQLIARAAERGAALANVERDELRRFLFDTVARIQVLSDTVEISLDTSNLLRWFLADGGVGQTTAGSAEARANVITLSVPARLKRTGLEMRFVIEGEAEQEADIGLTRIMVRAHSIRGRLLRDASLTIDEVAREENVGPSYVTGLLRLTFLAPDIVTGILTGRHPPELTARKLMADTRLPLDWNEQRKLLGVA